VDRSLFGSAVDVENAARCDLGAGLIMSNNCIVPSCEIRGTTEGNVHGVLGRFRFVEDESPLHYVVERGSAKILLQVQDL
jgi:hypothetical protein